MNKMALLTKSTVVSLVMSLLVACGGDKTATKEADVQSAPTAQVVRVGVDDHYPPYDFTDERGNPIGFDVEIIQAIAKHQNIAIEVVPQGWEMLMGDLDSAKNDLVMSGLTRTPEREQKYLVSSTYVWGQDVLAIKPETIGVRSLHDLVGKKTATLANSAYIPMLEAVLGKGGDGIVAKSTDFLAFQELAIGRVDAVLGEKHQFRHYAQHYPEVPFKIVDGWIEPYEIVILAPKANTELMTKVNAGLAGIVADGTYAQIYEKWFGTPPPRLPKV